MIQGGVLGGVVVYVTDTVVEIFGVKLVASKVFSILAKPFVLCAKTIGLGALHGCAGVLIAGIIDLIRCVMN